MSNNDYIRKELISLYDKMDILRWICFDCDVVPYGKNSSCFSCDTFKERNRLEEEILKLKQQL